MTLGVDQLRAVRDEGGNGGRERCVSPGIRPPPPAGDQGRKVDRHTYMWGTLFGGGNVGVIANIMQLIFAVVLVKFRFGF